MNTLKDKKSAFLSEEIPEERTKIEVETSIIPKNIDKELKSDIERTKALLEADPSIMFHIPLAPGEKAGKATESVTINGYRTEYPKGVVVKMPQSHAEILSNYLNIDMSDFARSIRVDRDAVKEGVPIDFALN